MSNNNFTAVVMSDKIQVAIKVRPLVTREKDVGEFWRVNGNELYLLNNDKQPSGEIFAYDHVFANNSTNMEVFEKVVKPLVNRAVKGFNATIFAYGQTSSGKTHTMLGDQNEAGITQLAVSSMFDFMKKSEGREFLVRASYMEIYNEKVNDLLEQQNNNLKIREKDGKIVVQRLKEELVADTAKIMSLLKRGQKIRRIGETNLNERSSRSHTIFRLIIESRESDMGDNGTIQVSQLNLVDLAGSERAGLAGTTGERLKEGCAINRSLFQLSQVVAQLSEGSPFVNFRDSKLTRILQCSLGGNAHTLIICTVTPASVDFTLSTLGFASRAKAVKNMPQVNEVVSDGTLIKKYARQLEKLQAELKATKERYSCHELEAVESKLEEQERLNSELQQRINVLMKTLIVAEPVPKPRFNRRRTWGGGQLTPLDLLKGNLVTIAEEDTSLVLTNDDFNTPYEDFEVQLIEDEREKGIEMDILPDSESPINLGNSSFGSSIQSTRASRNFSLSTYEECKEIQTSASIICTPVRHHMATNTTPPSANSLYWTKENKEHRSFVGHENDLILGLENQLELKEKELEVLQKSLSEKEEVLKNTLSFQESLTMKLVEYEQALEKTHKEKEMYSDKIETFHKENKDLKMQIQELKIQNNVNNDQIASFKEKLFKEVVSLNPNRSSQITNSSEPNEIFNILMNCIMEKQMEIVSHLQYQNTQTLHKNPELLDSNILEEENCQLRAALEKLKQEQVECNEKCVSFQKSMAELELQVEQLKIHNDELKAQFDSVYQEKYSILESYANIKVELAGKNHALSKEDKKTTLENCIDIENEPKEKELFLEEGYSNKCTNMKSVSNDNVQTDPELMDPIQTNLERYGQVKSQNSAQEEIQIKYFQEKCREQEETLFVFKEKLKIVENQLNEVNLQNGELKQQINNVAKEKDENVVNLERTLSDKCALEEKLEEQAKIINDIMEANNILELHVNANGKDSELEHSQKVCGELGEKIFAFTEKVKVLEDKIEQMSSHNRELVQQIASVEKEKFEFEMKMERTIEEKYALEKKLEEQAEVTNNIKEANGALEHNVQTNKKESEHTQKICGEQGELITAFTEKVKILEDRLKQFTLQNTEYQRQIEKLEKENIEKVKNLERIIEEKYALDEKLEEQTGIIKEIEEAKRALEENVSVFETELKEKNKLLLDMETRTCSTLSRNAYCDECVQTDIEEIEHENVLEKVLLSGCQNKSEKEYENIILLENQIKQDSVHRKELQEQIEKLEKERAEYALALEKALEETVKEQTSVINDVTDANNAQEMYVKVHGQELESKCIENACDDKGESTFTLIEKVKILEDRLKQFTLQNTEYQQQMEKVEKENIEKVKNLERTMEEKYALEEQLEEQTGIIKEIEEAKRALEQNLSVFETELKEKNKLLLDLETRMCNTLSRNAQCDEYDQTDVEEIEHENVLEKVLLSRSENVSEKEYEKINILETQIKQDSVHRNELQEKIEKLEKERAEYALALEKALEDKCTLEKTVKEQTSVINDIEDANNAREMCAKVHGQELESKCIENACDDKGESTFTLIEKVKFLEDRLKQFTLQNTEYQQQMEKVEKENIEKVKNLERTMEEKYALEEKLEEQTGIIKEIEEAKRALEQNLSVFETELKEKNKLLLDLETRMCNTLSRNAQCDEYDQTDVEEIEHENVLEKVLLSRSENVSEKEYEKINILENQIKQDSVHRNELQEKIEKLEKERAEYALALEKALEDKCTLEETVKEQTSVINDIKDANNAREMCAKVHGQELESKCIENACDDKGESTFTLIEKVKILEDRLKQFTLQNTEYQQQMEKVEKENIEKVKNLERTMEEKYALEEKLEEQTGIIKEIEEAKRALEQNLSVFETELKEKNKLLLDMETRMCNTLSRNAYCDEYVQTDVEEIEHENVLEKVLLSGSENVSEKEYEKINILENQIKQDSVHRNELQEKIEKLEKERAEYALALEKALEDKCTLEETVKEQTSVINDIKDANNAREMCAKVHGQELESKCIENACDDKGESTFTLIEKVKILEDRLKQFTLQDTEYQQQMEKVEKENIEKVKNLERTMEEKYALEEKLEEQTGIIKEIEEAKRALEENVSVFETELKEKNKLLLDLETRMCNTLSRNAHCDEYVQTDVEEIEHENVLEKVLLSGSQNVSEKEYEMEPINKQYDQEEKLSTLMEKVNVLERQVLQDSLQIEELHQQIEKLEKEREENCLALENVLADKCAYQTQVQEQCEIIQEIEKSKLALEMCVSNIESEKKQLLLEILQLRNSNSDECVQMNLSVTSPHNDNMRESLVQDTHNTNKKELLIENWQDKCGKEEKLFAFTEKVRILEEKCRQSSEQVEKLQSQIEMTENERVKNSMNLEKVLLDKCSLEERIEEQGLIIKEKEKNNFILQNHIGDLETELKEKKELLLVFQEEKYELENQLCSIKDKISSSSVVSERAKELETKLNEESECKREKELELAHLQEKLIEQGKQLSNFVANEKVLEDQLQVIVSQKEEMQHKIELLEKNILQCDLNFQNILEDKIALVEKVEELKKIIKDTEESKSTMMICINNLESELMEKKNLLLELQEHKNEIEKHCENLEETVKMKIETLESIKTELENNLKMELEYKIRQDKCISQYENELIELKHKLSASAENLKVLEEELQKEVLINKDMKSQINELEKCKVECEIKLKRTVEEKQILEKRIGDQISDFEESKTSFQQCVNNLEKELNAKKVIILGMEKQNSEFEDRHAILETQIENVEKEKLELENKLKEISNTKSEVERELAFTQKKLLEKESLFNDLLQEGKDLEEQFKKEKELKKEMQKQLTALLESKSNCEEQLNIEIEQRENITSKLNEVTCRCTQQERTIKELENNKASIEEQLQVLENYRSMEEVVRILKIQHNEEVICRENMKKELMSKEEELVQCKRQIQELNNVIDSLEFDNRVRDTQYNSQLQNLQEERIKLVETSKAQSKLESKLKDEVQCLQEQLSKQEEQLKEVKEQLQISINVTIKDNVIKQELLSQIQSLQDEKKEYELRLKKVTDERKQLQFRLSDLDKRAAQQDERAKECEEAQVDLAEMLQFRESKISWDGNKYVKEMELKQISDSRKSPPMQSKYTRHNLPLHNNKKQLIDEIEAKTDLENKLLILQNELTAAKNSEQELHQEKEKINKENIFLREYVKDLDTKLENQWIENFSLQSTLKTLFRIFRDVVQEQESPVEMLNSIIRHLRTHGISVPSESTFEKEKLESKIAELEKTVESLHETLRREGYHYSSPHWVRMGEWAISNRKMKQLEKKNQELQEEVEKLKSNKGSPASDQGLLDDTLFGKCLKSPKSPVCMKCEELKKQVAHLKEESGMKSMRITSLTYDLKCGNLEFKNKAEDLDQKSNVLIRENKRLRHDLEAFEAEAKRRAMKRNQESQTEPSSVPWDRLRAQGTGSKIAEDHVIDKLNETIKRLTSDKEQLKKVARELKRRNQELEVEKQSTSTTVQVSRRASSPVAVTPRRGAALQRLVRDANEIIAVQRQSLHCTHNQRNKENPCPQPERK